MVANPRQTERKVMNPRAEMAPLKTSSREYFMAIMAAMKNVLSPISDTMMTEIEAMKACMKPKEVVRGVVVSPSVLSWDCVCEGCCLFCGFCQWLVTGEN